jgi:hypothetical protein
MSFTAVLPLDFYELTSFPDHANYFRQENNCPSYLLGASMFLLVWTNRWGGVKQGTISTRQISEYPNIQLLSVPCLHLLEVAGI